MFTVPVGKVVNFMQSTISRPDFVKNLIEEAAFTTPVAKYLFANIYEIASEAFQKYEKIRVDKVKEYGTPIDLEGRMQIQPGSPYSEQFQEEMQEILKTDVEFNVSKIKASDANVPMKDQFLINWMLEV